jgi:hypothetical protein
VTGKGKLALYVRVSQKGKREGETFQSPKQQRDDATRHAKARGFEVSEPYDDSESVSGATPFDERPGLSRALAAIESGKLDGLAVATQCRIARPDRKDGDMLRAMQERIRAAGAVLLIADAPAAEVLDPAKELPTGYEALPADVRGLFDRALREEAAKRWLNAQRNAIDRGVHFCKVAPLGYLKNTAKPKVAGDDPARKQMTAEDRWADPVIGQLIPDPATANVVQALFKLRLEGGSWGECQALLLEHGIRHGESYGTVTSMIKNRAYLGEAYHGKARNPEAHAPLIDPSVWRGCQPVKETRTRSSEGFMLAGLISCACCGRKLTPGPYYRCRPKLIKGPECTTPAIAKAVAIEERVEGFLALTVAAAKTRSREMTSTDTSALELKLAAAQGALDKVYSLESILNADTVKLAALVAQAKDAATAAEDKLRVAREAAAAAGEIGTVLEAWPSMPVSERRRWLTKFGCRVVVRRGKEHIGVRAHIEFADHAYEALDIDRPALATRAA